MSKFGSGKFTSTTSIGDQYATPQFTRRFWSDELNILNSRYFVRRSSVNSKCLFHNRSAVVLSHENSRSAGTQNRSLPADFKRRDESPTPPSPPTNQTTKQHRQGVWRTGMSTLPAAPPIKYVLGYRSRTRTPNPNLKP